MKSRLYFDSYAMPAADIGPENPLPDLGSKGDIHSQLNFDGSVPESERTYFSYGKVSGILPYTIQDGYNRVKRERAFNAAILENDHLKAVFLPEIGGRLWSLYDKDAKKDLLHVNPVFQPANLALRNAWFSGGVEWNIGMTGHTPYTCSPLFAAEVTLPGGAQALRMYEWERIRRVSYQIDAYLPDDSRFLFVRIKLCNTHNEETPMYWWSNAAVPEAEDVRVIAPAETAYWFDYHRVINKRPVPVMEGIDRSYTTRVPHSMDTFFDLAAGQRKWITAVNAEGYGMIQTSTDRLLGRKLFMWGSGAGGRHWQEFLAEPGNGGYVEIQSGLAKTQMQHIPMPALAEWDWLEAYGAIAVDPAKAHGEWAGAYKAVDEALEAKLPRGFMEAELARINEAFASREAVAIKSHGSGWAALEKARLEAEGLEFPVNDLDFSVPPIVNEKQAPWRELLRDGVLSEQFTNFPPAAYLVQPEWRKMLETSVNAGGCGDNWHSRLQLGVMRCAAGDFENAKTDFEKSISLEPSAWAYRNLSVLHSKKDDIGNALLCMEKAAELNFDLPIAIEYSRLLLQAEQYGRLFDFINGRPADVRENWRIQMMKAQAAVHIGEFDAALEILNGELEVSDLREGEVLLSDLWIQLHKKILVRDGAADDSELDARVLREFPLPRHLDFRMRT